MSRKMRINQKKSELFKTHLPDPILDPKALSKFLDLQKEIQRVLPNF